MSHNLSQYNDFWLLYKKFKTIKEWEQELSSSQLIFTKSPGLKLPQSFSPSLQSQLQFFSITIATTGMQALCWLLCYGWQASLLPWAYFPNSYPMGRSTHTYPGTLWWWSNPQVGAYPQNNRYSPVWLLVSTKLFYREKSGHPESASRWCKVTQHAWPCHPSQPLFDERKAAAPWAWSPPPAQEPHTSVLQ